MMSSAVVPYPLAAAVLDAVELDLAAGRPGGIISPTYQRSKVAERQEATLW